jgi:DNA replication protein DnaC
MQHTILIPQIIKTTQSRFDYEQFWKLLFLKGRDVYGHRFSLHEEDVSVIIKLLIYFLKDEDQAKLYQLDLCKGIMLTGPVGCGKTTLMNLMRYFLPAHHRYTIKPCREIAIEFAKEGYEALIRHTRKSFNTYTNLPFTTCFDDLGLEPPVQHYGNSSNTMSEILLSRYDHFMLNSMLTHITTNLSATEIEERYGLRVRSRLREMLNLISFSADAKDKRL